MDDKVQTKVLAQKVGITTPNLIGVVEVQNQVKNLLEMVKGYKEFVVKPAHGSGGKGVLVIKSYTETAFETASGRVLTFSEVYQHISNILSGLYSLGGQYDVALIEELVHFSPIFSEYSYQGVPDVRVIVYKGYPAMSMMRLSTKASGGRANLHQGAVGVGLDIRNGKSLKGVMWNMPIEVHPDTNADLSTLEVPFWREHLLIAAKGYEMTGWVIWAPTSFWTNTRGRCAGTQRPSRTGDSDCQRPRYGRHSEKNRKIVSEKPYAGRTRGLRFAKRGEVKFLTAAVQWLLSIPILLAEMIFNGDL